LKAVKEFKAEKRIDLVFCSAQNSFFQKYFKRKINTEIYKMFSNNNYIEDKNINLGSCILSFL